MGALACCGAMLVFAGTANAAVSRDGWGLGIADDDAIGSFIEPPPSLTTDRFDRLRPKTFRFQIYWDAVGDPDLDPMEHQYIRRAIRQIKRVRDADVREIVATFKKHGDYAPTPAQYKSEIRQVVDDLGPYVDVWGPANEPNDGERWLTYDGGAGPEKLAQYSAALAEVVSAADPTALRTSPDFLDKCEPNGLGGCTAASLTELRTYLIKYNQENGDWGHAIAFHAYRGVHQRTRQTVDNLLDLAPSGKPVWITEVGGYGRNDFVDDPPEIQAQKVNWMLNGELGRPSLASHPRVTRIFYYHMKSGGPEVSHDSALLNDDLGPRPAWYIWCAAAHGDNAAHPDCAPPLPSRYSSFNGDRKADLIGVDDVNQRFAVAVSSGAQLGAPGTGTWLTGWGGAPHWASIGDFNGDHKTDMIGADPINARFVVATSDGSQLGAAGSGVWLTGWGGDPHWADVGDFNGDGKDDLIGADPVNNRFAVATSDGSQLGAAGSGVWLTGWSGDPVWAGVGDFNGDGKDDLIGSDPVNNRFAVALSDGSQLSAPGSGIWLNGWSGDPEWADVADFNGDGMDDLIMADPILGIFAVALSDGSQLGAPGSGSWLTGWGGSPIWAAAG